VLVVGLCRWAGSHW